MLKEPRIGGAAQLRLFVHEIGFDRACRAVDVHPTTLRRWLREELAPPVAAMAALYWLTSWGFSEACAEAHWSHQVLMARLRELQARVEYLAPAARLEAANEPRYHAPGLLVPLKA